MEDEGYSEYYVIKDPIRIPDKYIEENEWDPENAILRYIKEKCNLNENEIVSIVRASAIDRFKEDDYVFWWGQMKNAYNHFS